MALASFTAQSRRSLSVKFVLALLLAFCAVAAQGRQNAKPWGCASVKAALTTSYQWETLSNSPVSFLMVARGGSDEAGTADEEPTSEGEDEEEDEDEEDEEEGEEFEEDYYDDQFEDEEDEGEEL